MIANVTLSTKEQLLLQDQKSHEEQCILKYDNYANLAVDSQLKTIFKNNAQKEREHLQIINQLLNGQVPSVAGGPQQQSAQQQAGQQPNWSMSQQESIDKSGTTGFKASDKDMCIDMLPRNMYPAPMILPFSNAKRYVRCVKPYSKEDKAREAIFSYMQSKACILLNNMEYNKISCQLYIYPII